MHTEHEASSLFRREFLCLSAGIVGGLTVPGLMSRLVGAVDVQAETANPIDKSFLHKGLNALARAHHMSSMAGHPGASMIAGYFVGEQRPNLDPAVYKGIEGDLTRVTRGESVFGKKMSKKSKLSDAELYRTLSLASGVCDIFVSASRACEGVFDSVDHILAEKKHSFS